MLPLTARYQAITPARGFVLGSILTAVTHPLAELMQDLFFDSTGLSRFLTLFYSSMLSLTLAWILVAYGGQTLTYGVATPETKKAQVAALYNLGPGMTSFWH